MISYIHSTTVVVADQQAALEFYTNVLDWEVAIDSQMGPSMRFLTVVPPGSKTQLVLADPSWAPASATTGEPGVSRLTGIAMATPDIDATYATLTERGVKFKNPPEMMPWGAKATFFDDLDGNSFFLAEEQ